MTSQHTTPTKALLSLESLSKYSFSKTRSQTLEEAKIKEKPRKNIQIKYEKSQTSITETIASDSKCNNAKDEQLELQGRYQEIFDKISEMRQKRNAPVDTLGCSANHDAELPQNERDFQLLVSLVLSVQTKDEKTAEAMKVLKNYGLSIDSMNEIKEAELQKLVKFVNFYINKSKYIKKIAAIIKDEYKGNLPHDVDKIVKLPGVGYKIAVLFVNHATNNAIGIGVDTHVHRVSNRIGWISTKNPNETMKDLEAFVPKEHWFDINKLLVGFGQQICLPVNPQCHQCLINDICKEGKEKIKNLYQKEHLKKKVKKNDEGRDLAKLIIFDDPMNKDSVGDADEIAGDDEAECSNNKQN